MARTLAEFGELWPAERRLADWLRAGNREWCVISSGLPPENAPREHRLRASFLRVLALGGFEDCRPSEKGLRVIGAYVEGDGPETAETSGLDPEGCALEANLALVACRFPDPVLTRGAALRSLFLNGSALMARLGADRLEARGGVFLRGVAAETEVRLSGVKLGGDLDAANARFAGREGRSAIVADGLEAKGSVVLHGVAAEAELRLLGAKLGRDLELEAVKFASGDHGRALSLNRARINGTVFLRSGAKISGVVDLTGAEIGAIVDEAASWPRRLLLDRCRYGGFTGGAPVSAAARIRWLSLQEGAYPDGGFFPQPWEECARALRGAGHSAAAREVLVEKERRQRAAARGRMAAALGQSRAARAAAALEAGVRPHTDRVIGLWLRLFFQTVWDGIIGAVIGYGRRPMLAFAWLLGFQLLGWLILAMAEGNEALKPNLPQLRRAPEWVLCGVDAGTPVDLPSLGSKTGLKRTDETQYACFLRQAEARAYPRFSAFVNSADTLLPVVSLEMQSYWLPDDSSPRGFWTRVYLWLHIAAGWGLTLLAVAGFSGLVKQDAS